MKIEGATAQLRISATLVEKAKQAGDRERRSKTKQLEFWAMIGAAIAPKLNPEDCNRLLELDVDEEVAVVFNPTHSTQFENRAVQ